MIFTESMVVCALAIVGVAIFAFVQLATTILLFKYFNINNALAAMFALDINDTRNRILQYEMSFLLCLAIGFGRCITTQERGPNCG